ncbi:MAG: hypothetical protein IKM94_04090 [Alphaproteobacteria bacterium]|nr:hypothetical protein [Alphaproteobacteria bacterium]
MDYEQLPKYEWTSNMQDRVEIMVGYCMHVLPSILFNEIDIRYIETTMQTDRLYRLVSGRAGGESRKNNKLFLVIWLEQFLAEPNCPPHVRQAIIRNIGIIRANNNGKNKSGNANNFIAQRWMETCR